MYEEMTNDIILSMNLDKFLNKVIIFSKSWSIEKKDYIHRKIKLFDTVKNEIIYEKRLKIEQLVGLLESGLYTLMDGHIYFSNDVIKIRYDLLDKQNGDKISE